MSRQAILFALLACTGCGVHKPVSQTWRLVKQERGEVLVPPDVESPDLSRRTLVIDGVANRRSCLGTTFPVKMEVRKRRLLIAVDREMLLRQPSGWLTAWSAGLARQGCLRPGEELRVAERIAAALPLEPNAAFRLLHVGHLQTGEVDVGPYTRLQVVSPISRDGLLPGGQDLETTGVTGNGHSLTVAVKAPRSLLGYETAWYAVRPKATGAGLEIYPVSAERHFTDTTEPQAQPSINYFQFPREAAFYRLFYKGGQTGFTALAIGARTPEELEDRTRQMESANASCERLHNDLCLAIPKRVAVNPFLAVVVNGRVVKVPWGGTVQSAIRESGERDASTVLPKLQVLRLYRSRPLFVQFERPSPGILSLLLMGGEIIAWK